MVHILVAEFWFKGAHIDGLVAGKVIITCIEIKSS